VSQPPPWDDQDQPPDQGQPSPWPSGNQPAWPTPGQSPPPPPSWPEGGADQPPPPSWPPAGQPPYPGPGYAYGCLVFRIKALAGSPQNEDANNDAVVIGGNGQTYAAAFDGIAGHKNFDHGAIHVTQGETVTGSVTVQVPNGVTVSHVKWTALSGFGSTAEWIVHG